MTSQAASVGAPLPQARALSPPVEDNPNELDERKEQEERIDLVFKKIAGSLSEIAESLNNGRQNSHTLELAIRLSERIPKHVGIYQSELQTLRERYEECLSEESIAIKNVILGFLSKKELEDTLDESTLETLKNDDLSLDSVDLLMELIKYSYKNKTNIFLRNDNDLKIDETHYLLRQTKVDFDNLLMDERQYLNSSLTFSKSNKTEIGITAEVLFVAKGALHLLIKYKEILEKKLSAGKLSERLSANMGVCGLAVVEKDGRTEFR